MGVPLLELFLFYRKRESGTSQVSSPSGVNTHEFVFVCYFMLCVGIFTLVISVASARGWEHATRRDLGSQGAARKILHRIIWNRGIWTEFIIYL
jgi:hypothetical protein